jgi:hypothetical protein
MMKFIVYVSDERHEEPWTEEYDKEVEDPQKWAEDTISTFNANLRPGEYLRRLERVEVTGPSTKRHTWHKTNLITIRARGQFYDTYVCTYCGITGKRHGLSDGVTIDYKYKAKKYQTCDWFDKRR